MRIHAVQATRVTIVVRRIIASNFEAIVVEQHLGLHVVLELDLHHMRLRLFSLQQCMALCLSILCISSVPVSYEKRIAPSSNYCSALVCFAGEVCVLPSQLPSSRALAVLHEDGQFGTD